MRDCRVATTYNGFFSDVLTVTSSASITEMDLLIGVGKCKV
jgi:hypothetical protein